MFPEEPAPEAPEPEVEDAPEPETEADRLTRQARESSQVDDLLERKRRQDGGR